MENLGGLKSLQKLYLTNNKIRCVEGLELCENLEELYMSDQRLKGKSMTFNLDSMAVISKRCHILEANNNNISDPSPLAYLSEVETLKLENNLIAKIEDVEKILACMSNLRELDLRQNPIEKVSKIRDQVFMMSRSLETFNTKEILGAEREFLFKFYNIKGIRDSKVQQAHSRRKSQEMKESLEINGAVLKTIDQQQQMAINASTEVIMSKSKPNLNTAFDFHSGTAHTLSKKSFPTG